jgi:outer membrane receptor protein involved in Fe transport
LGERLVLNADFLFSQRDYAFDVSIPEFFHHDSTREKQYFTNVGADYAFGNSLHASLLATWSKNDTALDIHATRLSTGVPTIVTNFQNYAAMDLTAKLDGELFSLPDGAVRFSIGAGQTTERYASQTTTNRRAIDYGFGELLVPLVGADRGVPFVHRLELSLAARYTEYEDRSHPRTETDFGGETSPKVGLLWSPINGLALRGTYGESFRAANLTQVSRARSATNLARRPDTLNGRPFLLISGGPAGTLTPEKATSYTAGFDLKPTALPDFHLSGTYFDISYEDRIGISANPVSLILINPTAYPEGVSFSPTVEQIEEALRHSRVTVNTLGIDTSDPHAAAVILAATPNFVFADDRQRNLAVSKQHGVDLNSGYSFGTALGRASAGLQVTYILDYVQQATPSSPTLSVVNSVLLPVKLRGRASVGLSRGGFDGMLNLNYVDDYANPYAAGGSKPVSSWTTLDLTAAYEFGRKHGDLLHGLQFSLSVQNLLDREPPYVGISTGQALSNAIGFDPVNANPMGRLVSLEISKQFGGAGE